LGLAVLEKSGPVQQEVDEVFRTLEKQAFAMEPIGGGGGCGGGCAGKKKRDTREGSPGEGGC